MTTLEIAIVSNSIIGAFVAGANVAPIWGDDDSLFWKVKMSLFAAILTAFGLTLLILGIPIVLYAYLVRLWRILMIKSWIALWFGKWDNLSPDRVDGFINGWKYYKDKGKIGRRWMIEVAKRNNIELS
jgi:hypothetical protein